MRGPADPKGFTLIELLIAMVLSLAVLAAGFSIYQGSTRATTVQNLDLRMQDNARMAMDVLAQSFRRTGFMVNWNSLPDTTKIENVQQKVFVDLLGGAVTIVGGNLTSDTTLLNSAPRGASKVKLASKLSVTVGDVVSVGLTYCGRVSAVNGSELQLDDTRPTGRLPMYFPGKYLEDGATLSNQTPAAVRVLRSTVFRIDNTDPNHPVLMQNGEPLAEDIESLFLAYGMDLDNDLMVEGGEWVSDPGMTGGLWTDRDNVEKIRLVRITLVARSAQPDRALIGVNQTIPAIEGRPAQANVQDGYRRYILTRVVKTRNLDVLYGL